MIYISTQPVKSAPYVDQDCDIVVADSLSIKPTLRSAGKAARKRRKASTSVVPYARMSRGDRRRPVRPDAANMERWEKFMPLWSNFRSTAREKPGLRGLVDVMDGIVMIVDDDRDFRLWGGMLEENWD